MRIAAFDIGTNTILMLIADVDDRGHLTVVCDEHTIARLGKGVDKDRLITREALDRAEGILRSLLDIAKKAGCDRIVAGATSAMRDAGNRREVVKYLGTRLGLEVRILSADEEAQLTYRGTVSGTRDPGFGRVGVVDIGGGSTEIIVGTAGRAEQRSSIDIGAVRLTERWWNSYPADRDSVEGASHDIRKALDSISIVAKDVTWYGVAGTPTTLAAIALRLPAFDASAIDGHVLSRDDVETSFEVLSHLTLPQLRSHPQIHPDRADIMVAGTLILREIMRGVGIKEIGVSVRGLRYGMVLEGPKRLSIFD